jgi:preprotein translocase subunit SecG
MKRCPLCGAAYADEYRYCERDATLLVEAPLSEPLGDAYRQPQTASTSNGVNGIVVLLTATLLGLVFVCMFALTAVNRHDEKQARLQQEQAAQERANAQALAAQAQQTFAEAQAARSEAERTAREAERRARIAKDELARQRAAHEAAAKILAQPAVQVEQHAPPTPATDFPTLTEQAVAEAVDRWQAAQNKRDFATYCSLYASNFKGVKRTTRKTKTYGRATWLADRRQMFDKTRDMSVSVINPRIVLTDEWAEVSFDQYFRSATYNDWGPKILRLRMTASGPQIIYEELLASHRL